MRGHDFWGGPDPVHLNAADVNGDCAANNSDLVYLVEFILMAGLPPVGGCAE